MPSKPQYRFARILLVIAAALLAAALPGVPLAAGSVFDTAGKVLLYGYAVHQIPLTIFHEGSHYLAYKAFGTDAKIRIWPIYLTDENGKKHLTRGYVEPEKPLTGFKDAVASIAPYLVQLLVVDRSVEALYRQGTIRPNSLFDKYTQTMLQLNLAEPMMDALFGDDLAQFSRDLKVPNVIVAGLLQAAYLASYLRVVKARGNRGNIWMFYFRVSF